MRRESFFDELEHRYDDALGQRVQGNYDDPMVVSTLVAAIGAERTKALAKKIPRLVLRAIGKEALPDCHWCKGSGLTGATFGSQVIKVNCECTRRKRGENTFDALRARVERENDEQKIPQQDFSFGLEVTTKDGKVWTSGVRLPTEEEAGFYLDYFARHELHQHGYSTGQGDPNTDLLRFDIKRHDEQPMMKIFGGKRKTMSFLHGTCGLLDWKGWRPISGGNCECKKCKKAQKERENDNQLLQQFEIAERALKAGEISQEQFDEYANSPFGTVPEWMAKLYPDAPAAQEVVW